MRVVVCYDISDDRRRARVHRTLKAFGENIQESVFEMIVDDKEFEIVRQRVNTLVDSQDRVRYYRLCAACERRISGSRRHPQAHRRRWWIF